MSISRNARRRNRRETMTRRHGRTLQTHMGMQRLRKQIKAVETIRRESGTLPRQANGRFVPVRSWREKLAKLLSFGGQRHSQELTA